MKFLSYRINDMNCSGEFHWEGFIAVEKIVSVQRGFDKENNLEGVVIDLGNEKINFMFKKSKQNYTIDLLQNLFILLRGEDGICGVTCKSGELGIITI